MPLFIWWKMEVWWGGLSPSGKLTSYSSLPFFYNSQREAPGSTKSKRQEEWKLTFKITDSIAALFCFIWLQAFTISTTKSSTAEHRNLEKWDRWHNVTWTMRSRALLSYNVISLYLSFSSLCLYFLISHPSLCFSLSSQLPLPFLFVFSAPLCIYSEICRYLKRI